MNAALMSREEVAGFASEEEESFIAFDTERARNAKYIILTDPLDGSSNIDVNVSVGTIFSIYRRVSPIGSPVTLRKTLCNQAINKSQRVTSCMVLPLCWFIPLVMV